MSYAASSFVSATPPAARIPYAAEVVAYTDDELDRFLDECRVGRVIEFVVKDPENLPKEFFQRLRERATPLQSQQLDLHQVSARLLQTAAQAFPPPKNTSGSGAATYTWFTQDDPIDPEEEYQKKLTHERECYLKLIECGISPYYPITLLDKVSRNPEEHYEIIKFWCPTRGRWDVYSQQWSRWMEFRASQKAIRNGKRHNLARYEQIVKTRAAELGVGHLEDIHLEKDPERQDRLSTWVEFLNNEHAHYRRSCRKADTVVDESWKRLVASGVLYEHETRDFIHTPEFETQIATEEQVQRAAYERAVDKEDALLRASEAFSEEDFGSRLAIAEAQVEQEEEALKPFYTRWKMIARYRLAPGCQDSFKRDAEHRRILIQWILAQVPSIRRKAAQGNNGKRRQCAESDEEHTSKRLKVDKQSLDARHLQPLCRTNRARRSASI